MTDDEMIAPEGEIKKEIENTPPEVQPSPVPPPAAPQPLAQPAAVEQQPVQDDIQRILKEVKLPERRDFKASADASPKEISQEPEASILEERIVKPAASKKEADAAPVAPDQGAERFAESGFFFCCSSSSHSQG